MKTKLFLMTLMLFLMVKMMRSAVITHPCMLHTASDIIRVRTLLDIAPWSDAYTHLEASSYAQSTYTEHTSALLDGYLKRMDASNWGPNGKIAQYEDYSNYTAAMRDAAAAYQLALRYQISGNTDYADAAVSVLNAWADNCKGILMLDGYTNNIPDPNEYLINIQAYQFANAAELLRDYDGWDATDFADFQTWMKNTFYTVARLFLENHHGNIGNMHYWLNWDLASLTAVLSIGILCDDENLIDYAISYFKTNTTEVGYVRNAIPYLHQDDNSNELLGQCEESGRDQGHATLCVALLGAFCQMASNVGEDLFAYDNYRALSMAEYVAKYNLMTADTYGTSTKTFVYDHNTFPYTAYSNPSYTCDTLSATGRGTIRPVWELFAGYAQANGLSAIYSQHWADMMRMQSGYGSDGGAGDYGTSSGGFDQLGYGTLMYARPDTKLGASADTYVRKNNTSNHGSETTMEIYTYDTNDADFVGLLSFDLPNDSFAKGRTVKSALLRLVTERFKGDATLAVYAYGHDVEESTTYAGETDYISAARATTPVATVSLTGIKGISVVSDTISDSTYLDIAAWTNAIDLTTYIDTLTSSKLRLMLAKTQNENFATKIFTHDAADISNSKANFTVESADLVPQLTIEYEDGYVLHVTAAGASTLVLPFTALIPQGVKTYTLDYLAGTAAAVATEITGQLPAAIPVLVNADEGSYTFSYMGNYAAYASAVSSGALTGVFVPTAAPSGSYVLQSSATRVGFYPVNTANVTVPACRAYLSTDTSQAKSISISYGKSTGIETFDMSREVYANTPIYDLYGRRVRQSTNIQSGIYIRQGSKFIVR